MLNILKKILLRIGKAIFWRVYFIKNKVNNKKFSAFLEDIVRTRNLQSKVQKLKNEGIARSIDDINIPQIKKSDTIFILGSGASINDLTDKDWDTIKKHDSVGFNFWMVHDFVPTYYFFEPCLEDDRHKVFLNLLEQKKHLYSRLPLICNYKYWIDAKKNFDDFPCEVKKSVYLSVRYYFFQTSTLLIKSSLAFLSLMNFFGVSNLNMIIHHSGTLSAIVMFAALSGYKNIVMVGVDLNSTNYFWDDDPKKYPVRPRKIEIGKVHFTADKHRRRHYWIPVTEYLDIFNRIFLRHNCIKLFIGSKKSLLYPQFPSYKNFRHISSQSARDS